MEFYTQNGLKRPIRLCEPTRKFAQDSLARKYGLDTLKVDAVSLDDIKNYDEMSLIERYDAAIYKIATHSPIRICQGERISGSA
ncbi:MAG: hypothetical protein II346_07020, partial [Ruminococcus sp.]|nr:hypothetical protein [Ruminococcus sp.]